jgi:hypothetical protein
MSMIQYNIIKFGREIVLRIRCGGISQCKDELL